MSIDFKNCRDPRVRLMREKYFNIRPRPLERWLWAQGIPASAERVFWLHWQEGVQRGDWYSEIPLRQVARECQLDTSTVTRAYQLLSKLGCLRRTDPGRNPANPFHQATALTEVRLPPQFLAELHQFPSRQTTPTEPAAVPENSPREIAATPANTTAADPELPDPLTGLTGRERARAVEQYTRDLSTRERHAFQESLRSHRTDMAFDDNSKLSGESRAVVLSILTSMAKASLPAAPPSQRNPPTETSSTPRARPLTLFELARLKRDIQTTTSIAATPELLRQVIWSIESGALKRFAPQHAIHIALKKIRLGTWTRPNRLPPQWAYTPRVSPAHETCRIA